MEREWGEGRGRQGELNRGEGWLEQGYGAGTMEVGEGWGRGTLKTRILVFWGAWVA